MTARRSALSSRRFACLRTYRFFRPGDEEGWARLETSVAEFDREKAARSGC